MEQTILNFLGRRDYQPMNTAEIAARMQLPRERRSQLAQALDRLERAGQVARLKQGERFALVRETDLVSGRIRMNRRGIGLLQPDLPKQASITIPSDATSTAMNGDHVLVRPDVRAFPRPGQRTETTGRVVRILERARQSIVGTLQRGREFLYVIPDDPRILQDIVVAEPRDVGRPARVGDKVVVELHPWTSRHVSPEGEVIEVLGAPDAEGVDMLSVLREYQLPLHFPKKALQEATAFGDRVKPAEIAARVDCRQHRVFTIDPEDAKDFDDAICVERGDHGQWRVWVHIADVSHYVKVGTALDQEAARRGNSTYLVDRVIPMLPEALSNELCSLKPNVERLTKCVEFTLAASGQVLQSKFYPAVICSRRRYGYREAFEVLQRQPADDLERSLHQASVLAQKIRKARFAAGSLNLDFPEKKIRLDDRGRILRIETVENDLSHQLIEEFMLLANEAVAARLMQLQRPALYRIHEPPNEQRLQELREEVLSHGVACGNLTNRDEVQKLLQRLDSAPFGAALKIQFLRSLMRARYSVEPLGHYGLAKKKYAHFTSPIRRYADLAVHRALFAERGQAMPANALQELASHISETERTSDDAERDSRDVKLFAWLSLQLKSAQPPVYRALVVDVRNFGLFVDVPDVGMGGLVPVSGMTEDFFHFEPQRGQLIGRRTRRVFKLGDYVQVKVAKVDSYKRQVDYALADGAKDARHALAGARVPRLLRKDFAGLARTGATSFAEGAAGSPRRRFMAPATDGGPAVRQKGERSGRSAGRSRRRTAGKRHHR